MSSTVSCHSSPQSCSVLFNHANPVQLLSNAAQSCPVSSGPVLSFPVLSSPVLSSPSPAPYILFDNVQPSRALSSPVQFCPFKSCLELQSCLALSSPILFNQSCLVLKTCLDQTSPDLSGTVQPCPVLYSFIQSCTVSRIYPIQCDPVHYGPVSPIMNSPVQSCL